MYVFSWPYRTKNLERSLVTVFVKDNRALISDFHVSQDIIVSDFEGCQKFYTKISTYYYYNSNYCVIQMNFCQKMLDLSSKLLKGIKIA